MPPYVEVSNLIDLFYSSDSDKMQNTETTFEPVKSDSSDNHPSTPSSTEDEALKNKHQSKKKNGRRALDKAPSSTEDEMPLGSQASSLSVPKRPLPARDRHSSKQVEVSNLMDSFDHSDHPSSTPSSTED
ncbi:dentin sialophosphoprotein-like [Solea solea]|uniref:dentin sialophosphoprotein-like n=1 Tax=Solea solea TaxID=90069 RepID=UPI00272AE555|nr:dentin sialophosphoprotein-like [Solea solea]XP_058488879.1 dentin sialophosphoprotein-like [Solea solea]